MLIAQRRQDPCGGNTHRAFHKSASLAASPGYSLRIISRLASSKIHEVRQSSIRHIRRWRNITGQQSSQPGPGAPKIAVRMNIRCDSGFLLHIQECFCICVSAMREDCNEQVRVQTLSCVCIQDTGRLSSPVYLHGFSGTMLQIHGCFRFMNIVCVILVELRRLVRQLNILPALLTVLYPEQAQRIPAYDQQRILPAENGSCPNPVSAQSISL